MNEEELVDRLSRVITKHYLIDLIALGESDEIPVAILHHLCYQKGRNPIAFRAAWILEYVASRYPHRFMEIFETFIGELPQQKNFSCLRHFTKILMMITGPQAPLDYVISYKKINRERLAEVVFNWLINAETPVAVQANCLDVLYNMSNELSWISEELRLQIEFLLREGSPAIQSRGRKILAKLERLKL